MSKMKEGLYVFDCQTSLQLQHIRLLSRLAHGNRGETFMQNEDCITAYCLPGSQKCPFLKHLLCLIFSVYPYQEAC